MKRAKPDQWARTSDAIWHVWPEAPFWGQQLLDDDDICFFAEVHRLYQVSFCMQALVSSRAQRSVLQMFT